MIAWRVYSLRRWQPTIMWFCFMFMHVSIDTMKNYLNSVSVVRLGLVMSTSCCLVIRFTNTIVGLALSNSIKSNLMLGLGRNFWLVHGGRKNHQVTITFMENDENTLINSEKMKVDGHSLVLIFHPSTNFKRNTGGLVQ